MKQARLSDETDSQLTALSKRRKNKNIFPKSKQDIVAEAIKELYKKECVQSCTTTKEI